jgi:predicted DNA-binding protein (MmcQ/YjbR family)
MTLDRFRAVCLTQPGATEQMQWGVDAVFKVGGKMFAVACTDHAQYPHAPMCSFKCDDETFAELVERDGVVPAPYLARAKWVALERWSALTDKEVATYVAAGYRLVRGGLPKKIQRALDGAAVPSARSRPRRTVVR